MADLQRATRRRKSRDQAVHPYGTVGRLMGFLMGWMNAAQNRLTVDQLEVGPGHAVLEIGFGPGRSLKRLADTTQAGFIAGLDHSALMVETARSRNARTVKSDRMEIVEGDVADLPWDRATFDTVLAINSFMQWPDQPKALKEIARVLKPGGTLTISVRIPHRDQGYETREQALAHVKNATNGLEAAGFYAVHATRHTLKNRDVTLVSAIVPKDQHA